MRSDIGSGMRIKKWNLFTESVTCIQKFDRKIGGLLWGACKVDDNPFNQTTRRKELVPEEVPVSGASFLSRGIRVIVVDLYSVKYHLHRQS